MIASFSPISAPDEPLKLAASAATGATTNIQKRDEHGGGETIDFRPILIARPTSQPASAANLSLAIPVNITLLPPGLAYHFGGHSEGRR